jgi:8-oxo-dGTP diphosphatase
MNVNAHRADTQVQPRNNDYFENRFRISLCFVIFALEDNQLKVLCKKVEEEEPNGNWILPSGTVNLDEGVRESAEKSMQDLTQTQQIFHEQLQTFGGAGFTPLTVAYYALLPMQNGTQAIAAQKALRWWDVAKLPQMSAEHVGLVSSAMHSFRLRAACEPIIFQLLPERFTLLQLQQAYEEIFGIRMGKSNFRRKVARMKFLLASPEWQQNVAHRAARLYEFDKQVYQDQYRDEFFLHF